MAETKDDIVKFDFGGQVITVPRNTFTPYMESLFGMILKGRPDTDDGRYLMRERNPSLFKHILKFFQEEPLRLDAEELQQLKEEAKFYWLPALSHYLNYLSIVGPDAAPGFRFATGPNYDVSSDGLEISKSTKSQLDVTAVTNPIPSSGVHYLKLKLVRSDAGNIFVGVCPSNIDQTVIGNCFHNGWYFCTKDGTLSSWGHKQYYKGPKILTGREVGVKMDMTKGEISFTVDGEDHGVAFDKIPVKEKKLSFCVLMGSFHDTVRIIE